MVDRIEELFQQVMNEACPDPLRRFAELVAADAVAREREINQELLEALKEIVDQHGKFEHCLWAAHIARKAIAKAEEQA